ncbi:MAG: hypothetical protein ACXIT9_13040 [Nitritalea sp.]
MGYVKSITYVALLCVGFFFVSFETTADCTLTTKTGTDGRCFMVDGEFTCLERSEDNHCFTNSGGGDDSEIPDSLEF